MSTLAPPAALAYSAENCTIGRALDILGERWTFVVLREVFIGIRRFDDMRVRTAIPRQVLSSRLALLVEHGILRKEPYQVPGSRMRHEYRLTEKGFDLYPVLVALAEWGNKHAAGPEGPPAVYVHGGCGAQVHLVAECEAGHRIDSPRELHSAPGPGAVMRRTVSG